MYLHAADEPLPSVFLQQGLKDVLGVNMAALQFLQRASAEKSGLTTEQRLLAARRALGGT